MNAVMNDKERIKNCYRQMYLGMVEKDRNILAEVLDDSFVLVHMTGMRQSKTAFIRAVFGGGPHAWRLQLKMKLIQRANSWKITEAKASTY